MLPLAFELIYPLCQLKQEKFFPFNSFPHDIKFRKRLMFFYIELRNTRNLIDNLSPLEITHLHDPGNISLHDDIVAMRFYPVLCEVINNVALLAEPFIEVIIAIIPVAGTFDSSFDLSSIRKFKCNLCSIPVGIEVDQIG